MADMLSTMNDILIINTRIADNTEFNEKIYKQAVLMNIKMGSFSETMRAIGV